MIRHQDRDEALRSVGFALAVEAGALVFPARNRP
jgi:hypothetical protein